ncbi:MAG: M48 family metalloprotease [Chlamydiae bacterium]|nr:M48 family metalloprotease [Chlamydiota bacterium]
MIAKVGSYGPVEQQQKINVQKPSIVKILSAAQRSFNSFLDYLLPKNLVNGKREIRLLPCWMEEYIGSKLYPYLCINNGGETLHEEWQKTVEKIGMVLANHSSRPDLQREFSVLRSREKSSWAVSGAGGKFAVYEGLLKVIYNDTSIKGYEDVKPEDKIAYVLAREMVHVDARHTARKIEKMAFFCLAFLALRLVGFFASQIFDKPEYKAIELLGVLSNLIFPFYSSILSLFTIYLFSGSKSQEYEADKYAIHYMQKAGYNPKAALWLHEYLKTQEIQTPIFIKCLFYLFSSYPSHEQRLLENHKTLKTLQKAC